jgi:hypothetical protein
MSLTAYHAKYFAHDLTRRAVVGIDRLSMSPFDAAVDLNPIDTARCTPLAISRIDKPEAIPRARKRVLYHSCEVYIYTSQEWYCFLGGLFLA